MEIEENSVLDHDYHKDHVVVGHEDDYTNPEEMSNENPNNNEAITENSTLGFKKLSSFCKDSDAHRITLAIELSKNHPVLINSQFINEMKEKIKGISIISLPDKAKL